MKPNPVPILHQYCGIKVHHISPKFPLKTPLELVHAVFTDKPIEAWLHAELMDMTLQEWGTHPDQTVRRLLWQCYFPDTRPHILHKLVYEQHQFGHLISDTTLTERMLRKYLTQPKLHQFQLRKVARFAITYADAIGSKSRRHGPDPAYMGLYYALRDPKRMYAKGEIITD